jgi:ryanodine receptor 2
MGVWPIYSFCTFQTSAVTYQPDPINTDDVDLPDGLTPLVERLAEHVHDTWAQRRMDEGWSYGSERDDQAKTHPCLVPYDELPEVEKDYDRETAIETLKAVKALGYTITPPEDADGISG